MISDNTLESGAVIRCDPAIFDPSIQYNHRHFCTQCWRMYGCNGIQCDKDDDSGWCGECRTAEYVMERGGN